MERKSKNFLKKEKIANEILNSINNSYSVMGFEYQGVNANQLTSFRQLAKKNDSELIVYKNNLVNIAIKNLVSLDLKKTLSNQLIYLFSHNNAFAGFKVFREFKKEFPKLQLKLAYFEKKLLDKNDLNLLLKYNSINDIYASLASLLNATILKLAIVLNMINKK